MSGAMERRGGLVAYLSGVNSARAWVVLLLALAVASSLVPGVYPWETAPRLLLAAIVVLFLPGWITVRRLGWFAAADNLAERAVLSFAVSYGLVTLLCIFTSLVHLNLISAAVVLGAYSLGLSLLSGHARIAEQRIERDRSVRPKSKLIWAVGLVLGGFIIAFAWTVELPIGGEAIVDLKLSLGSAGSPERTRLC